MSRQFWKVDDHPEIHVSTFHLFLAQVVTLDAQNWSISHCAWIYELPIRIWDPIFWVTTQDQFSTLKTWRPFCHKKWRRSANWSSKIKKSRPNLCKHLWKNVDDQIKRVVNKFWPPTLVHSPSNDVINDVVFRDISFGIVYVKHFTVGPCNW